MEKIKTYPEMNERLKDLLRMSGTAMELYTAQRIEELENENKRLREALEWISYDAPPRWAEKAAKALGA